MSLAERARRGFESAIGLMNAIGTLWIFGLMLLINADILARELLGAPLRGVAELVSLSIVGIVFLELPHALWCGRLTRNDALLRYLAARRPRLVRGLESGFALAGAFVFLLLTIAGVAFFERAIELGEYVGALGDFTAPTWPIRAILVLGSAATALGFLGLAWQARGAERP